jgi:hypothetical protein
MMSAAKLVAATAFFVLATSLPAKQSEPRLLNVRFATPDRINPTVPAIWERDRAPGEYRLVKGKDGAGRSALRLFYDHTSDPEGYAGVLQRVSLTPASHNTMTARGWLKKDNAASLAGLWVSFADAQGKKLAYHNDYGLPWKKPIGWNRRALSVAVPPNAARVTIGASIFEASGTLLISELSFSSLATPTN